MKQLEQNTDDNILSAVNSKRISQCYKHSEDILLEKHTAA